MLKNTVSNKAKEQKSGICITMFISHVLLLLYYCRHWIQVAISLTVVMGIAWLAGLLAFRRELLPIVYIITIFIAAQGIILFIILVPMAKQVCVYWYFRYNKMNFYDMFRSERHSNSNGSKEKNPCC